MDIGVVEIVTGIVVVVLGPGGAAWTGVKLGLNGVRTDVTEIKGDVKGMGERITQNEVDIAFMKGREDRT